ncbi:hypothetical protein K8R42_02490 [bacterium]|nr:hypothetical protein [bacterium]
MKLEKMSAALVGFLQVIGVAIYCSLVALFFWSMGNNVGQSPEFLGIALMLFLLVFSATFCGLLVFAYPAYLIINKQTKKALKILGFTLLYAILIFVIILLIILI